MERFMINIAERKYVIGMNDEMSVVNISASEALQLLEIFTEKREMLERMAEAEEERSEYIRNKVAMHGN